jgi:hypothetical protein
MGCSNVFENVRQTVARAGDHLQLGHPAMLAQRLSAQYFEFHDDWLDRPDALASLTRTIEGYLSAYFPSHQWHAWRRLWPVNLCQLLAYLHLVQDNLEQAMHMAELWRMTGATPGAQRAAAQLASHIRDQLRGEPPDCDRLAAIAPEHRCLVTEPRLNPFRHVADQAEPLAWEAEWNRRLRDEYERFFASFFASFTAGASAGDRAEACHAASA